MSNYTYDLKETPVPFRYLFLFCDFRLHNMNAIITTNINTTTAPMTMNTNSGSPPADAVFPDDPSPLGSSVMMSLDFGGTETQKLHLVPTDRYTTIKFSTKDTNCQIRGDSSIGLDFTVTC